MTQRSRPIRGRQSLLVQGWTCPAKLDHPFLYVDENVHKLLRDCSIKRVITSNTYLFMTRSFFSSSSAIPRLHTIIVLHNNKAGCAIFLTLRSKCNTRHFYHQQMRHLLLAALFDRASLFRPAQTRPKPDFLLDCDSNKSLRHRTDWPVVKWVVLGKKSMILCEIREQKDPCNDETPRCWKGGTDTQPTVHRSDHLGTYLHQYLSAIP